MSHERKLKDGKRKDKKTHNMREAEKSRKEAAAPAKAGSDQGDIQNFKPGAANDKNRQPNPNQR